MTHLTRRTLLRSATAVGAGALLAPNLIARRSDDTVRLAVIGLKGRGRGLLEGFERQAGVQVVALCDVDSKILAREVEPRAARGVAGYTDLRRVFEREDVDAVVIATPNHWHALASIWAMQSGKDVYVEKPVSWTISEGRRMVETAAATGRICAAGFQNRSDTSLQPFMERLHAGEWGEIRAIRGLCYRKRAGIGARLERPRKPPESVDYDLWLGPADDLPLTRPNFHYDWHWVWNTGNGDMGNQGPHELDLMRWALGDPPLPTGVSSFGGRFGWDDAGETPNLHGAIFQGAGVPLTFEVRDLTTTPTSDQAATFAGLRVGVVVTCEGGEFRGGRGGGRMYDPDGKQMERFTGGSGTRHIENFLACVRSRRAQDLRSGIEQAHLSSALAHLANISLRAGAAASPEQVAGHSPEDARWQDLTERLSAHAEAWGVDWKRTPFSLGADLGFDPGSERFTGGDAASLASSLATRPYRDGFRVPEKV